MLKIAFNGFMMALADSVPGVSGGTVAFIMGFVVWKYRTQKKRNMLFN